MTGDMVSLSKFIQGFLEKKAHEAISKTDVIYIMWPSKFPKAKSIIYYL